MSEPSINLEQPHDMSGIYQAHRENVAQASAADELLQRVNSRQPQSAGQPQSGATILPAGQMQQPPATSSGGMAWRATKDIGGGLVETPRAIVTGARDALINSYDAIDDFSKWAGDKISNATGYYGIHVGKDGVHLATPQEVGDTHSLSSLITGGKGTDVDPADVVRQGLDEYKGTGTPKTVTGGLIKNVAQFVTGLAVTNKALGAVGVALPVAGAMGYTSAAMKGASANFLAFDPHQQRLSNLVEQFPQLSNPVTQYLESKPDDNNAEGRLKNALEGLGLGALTDGFLKSIKLLRNVAVAKSATEGMQAAAETPGVGQNAFEGLGDETASPSEPLLRKQSVTSDVPANGEVYNPASESITNESTQQNQPPIGRTAEGGTPEDGWRQTTGIRVEGSTDPLTVYRGGEREVSADHFSEEALGQKTGHPSSGLGVFFTTSPEEASQWGDVRSAHLDIRNPKVINVDELPGFDSVEDAQNYSKSLQQQGFDGLVIQSQHVGGHDWVVAFNPKQVIHDAGRSESVGVAGDHINQVGSVTPQQLKEAATNSTTKQPQTYINFARIDTPEDVQRAIQELADNQHTSITNAQRGTQTFQQIELNASQQNAWKILSERRTGEPLNAEQSVAARQLWASSADKLTQLAQTATEAPNEANLFAFRKMLSVHNAIQSEVIGARTETARALASWRIPVGSSESRLMEVSDRLQELGGGIDNVRDMAAKVVGLAKAGMDNELEAFAEKSAYAKTRDALIQAWTDGLLTAPTTQTKILASNVTTALWRMGERALGQKISGILGTQDGIAPGEVGAQWSGLINGFKDAATYGWKSMQTGVTGEGIGEPHQPLPSNLSADALGLDPDSFAGRAMDYLGTALSLPRRGIAAQHDMALTLAYRMELNAQAVRQATGELNAGNLTDEAFGARIADLVQNPPPNINIASVKGARYQAFLDDPGKIAQTLLDLRQELPAVRVILPFIKIPARIFSYAFERTPLAPLMSDFRANIAAGGARRDLALAQVSLGTMIMMTAADMTMSGRLKAQGPLQKGLQQAQVREGERNWSVQVGDKWIDVNGIHPIGKLFTLAASTTEALMNGQQELKDDADTEKIASATTLAIASNLANTSYTQGLANFFAVLHDGRAGGEGEQALKSTTSSLIPAVVGAAARATDPYQREVYSMLDEFKSRIPGLSKTLPAARDLWGNPIPSQNGALESLVSPAQTRDVKHAPIDDEILKQGFNITTPPASQSFGQGAMINLKHYPEAYSRFLELAGHDYKSPAWGVGAQELLNSVVSGDHPLSQIYQMKSNGPEGGKELMIRELLNQYREGAKHQLLDEYPTLQTEVSQKKAAALQLKMPVLTDQGAGQ